MNCRRFSGLSLLFVTIGCFAGERDHARTARVDTLASGRVVVANTGRPLWSPKTAWQLEEDLRIGAATHVGPEAEQFGDIASIASDSRGRIYVLDRMSKDIKVFDPDGTFSHAIGREGHGPGELALPHAVVIGAGDTIWVVDDGAVRYSAFAPDGTFLTSQFRRIRGYMGATPGAFLENGRYVDWMPVFPDGRMGARLELFFDLSFVVAVAQAAIQLEHFLAEGHPGSGLVSYLMVFAAIWWVRMRASSSQ